MPVKDLTGQTFGRLTVIARDGVKGSFAAWRCECSCGNYHTTSSRGLIGGTCKSCGCFRREHLSAIATEHNFKHGHNVAGKETRTHKSWTAMLSRCRNENDTNFPNYGGRGISVCERWFEYVNFLADMGERPPGKSIDRTDVNGNYEPNNCRWATGSEQQRNKRCHVK